jgi:hypothetical protein
MGNTLKITHRSTLKGKDAYCNLGVTLKKEGTY